MSRVEGFSSHWLPTLYYCPLPLDFYRNVSSFLSFTNFQINCSSELGNCMPPPFSQSNCTKLSSLTHPFSIQKPNGRVNPYLHVLIIFMNNYWSICYMSVFSPFLQPEQFQEESIKTPLNWIRFWGGQFCSPLLVGAALCSLNCFICCKMK